MGQIAYKLPQVRMVELVDTQDLGSCAERCEGSSPFTDTISLIMDCQTWFLILQS